ncbi:iron(III) transport system substrate-binding protein [Kribbella sp. VKM Ac-2527]|uniref:Iron(III) transport system substrate-binding protein n=1 Tax=Kribbella caucasensis TaxID=2512215 RepID=A0A4R6KHT1_9ACTN|nr:extracellular solute-binding protein [Kribbella sp. VKM Ac-2527]TDO48704.1 iron(III) transport system substrate-binding protein [Kribbella sp. VKM Ac-2527]
MVLAAVLSGCLSSGEGAAEAAAGFESISSGATSEGAVTWYVSIPEAVAKGVADAFSGKYGIGVEMTVLTSGLLATRYSSEMSSGKSAADVVTLADPVFFKDAVAKQWVGGLDPADEPALETWPDTALRENSYALVNIQPIGVTIDTKKAKAADFGSWEGLLAPSLKGQVYLVNPANVPSWLAHMNLLRKTYGDGFLAKLAAQSPKLVDSSVPGVQQVAAGSGTLVYPSLLSVSRPLSAKGASVETVFPSPTTGVEQFAAVSSAAPHPNAARLFLNFLLTEEAQKILNKGTGSSPLGNLEGTVPLPDGYVSPDVEAALAAKAEIVSGLGLG